MSIYQLRSIAGSLNQAEESEVKVQEEIETGMTVNLELAPNNDEGEDSQELRAQALRALLLECQRKRSSEDTKKKSSDVEVTSESGAESSAAVEGKTSAKRSRVLDSDDDEDERGEASLSKMNTETEGGNQSDEETRFAPAKRRRNRVLSDDEDD